MGLNMCKVVNKSDKMIFVVTFNNSDTIYWYYRELCQVPKNGEELEVDGLAGGGAVKVGVIYNILGKRVVYDLFKVSHGATLTVHEVSPENGVERFSESKDIRRMARGRSIKMSADHAEGVTSVLRTAGNYSGVVSAAVSIADFTAAFIFK